MTQDKKCPSQLENLILGEKSLDIMIIVKELHGCTTISLKLHHLKSSL